MELEDRMDIDEDLHCRQIIVYGRNTVRRLFECNVLVSGLQGLGAEIAKNLILDGVKSVTLHDERTVELWDLSSSFVLSESDVGNNRAEASVRKLQELNKAVMVNALPGKLTKEQLSNYQVVVFTASDLKTAIEFNDYCHNHQPPIPFIKADVNGLFGNVFCDFGPEFIVSDIDGEEPHTGIISAITNDNPALVSCINDERLQFQDGDFVVFSEIYGMKELNDGKQRKIMKCSPYSFYLEEDTTNFGKYEKGGIVSQVKQPKVLNFRSLEETLNDPKEFLLSDFSKPDHPPVLHLAFLALDTFRSQMGGFPIAGSEEDANELRYIAAMINENSGDREMEDIKPELLWDFAHGARAVLSPMATMFGGIVSQEVVKACSGMFHPIFQLFYFDSVESLPKPLPDAEYRLPLDSRYDAQISVFGSQFQKKLEETRIFIVGSGSLGCEFLKNLALMGASCGTKRTLTITDDDLVEKSNLGNQLLFHDSDIGRAKSYTAASAASLINPNCRIVACKSHVGPNTQKVFDIPFWKNLQVIISAVDNVDSRIYVDQRCVRFKKPLLVCGTMGTKCSTQVVIPLLTENYGASMDPIEKQVPECARKYFPYNINHCVTWAMSEFEDLLEDQLYEVNAYLSAPTSYLSVIKKSSNIKTLKIILRWIDAERCQTFQDCIRWARLKFEHYFTNQVKDMISKYPEDLKTDSGTPFWSPPKRFPRPLEFNKSDPSHLRFILDGSKLCAEIYDIPIPEWADQELDKIVEAVDKVIVPNFQPNQDDTNATCSINDTSLALQALIQKVEQSRKSLPLGLELNPIKFNKDTDFLAGLANMRARNYNIPEVDKLTVKAIAGSIIPKIASCTAVATGLVCLELYKVVNEHHRIEDYRNTFANLALPLFSMAEPLPSKVYKHRDESWNTWDNWNILDNPTLEELITRFEEKGLHVHEVSYEDCVLYNTKSTHMKRRKKVVDLVRDEAKVGITRDKYYLVVTVVCVDDAHNVVNVPPVYVYFRKRFY